MRRLISIVLNYGLNIELWIGRNGAFFRMPA